MMGCNLNDGEISEWSRNDGMTNKWKVLTCQGS